MTVKFVWLGPEFSHTFLTISTYHPYIDSCHLSAIKTAHICTFLINKTAIGYLELGRVPGRIDVELEIY